MIDWIRVNELKDEIGSDDFSEVIALFLIEVEETLTRMNAAQNDAKQMQDLVHFLKGSALNIGFSELAEACSSAEKNSAGGKISIDVSEFRQLYDQSRKRLEAE